MKSKHYKTIVLLLFCWASNVCFADGPETEDRSRVFEKYAIEKYGDISEALIPVFKVLGDFGELGQHFNKKKNPENYKVFCDFIIRAFEDAMHGDVIEAMFANAILAIIPPELLLPIIGPELGPEGRLFGILYGRHSDVAKHIQRQPQQGNIGSPNLIEYTRYLENSGGWRKDHPEVRSIIIDKMFRIDPQEAFNEMLRVDYYFTSFMEAPNCYFMDNISEVQPLQIAYVDISNFLYRIRFSTPEHPFPIPKGLEEKVRSHLKELLQHEHTWVKLYVAYLLKYERQFRYPEILDLLSQEQDSYIQKVLTEINDNITQEKKEKESGKKTKNPYNHNPLRGRTAPILEN